MAQNVFVVGGDNVVRLDSLIDDDNASVTDATVTLTGFADEDTGTPIASVTLPLAMPQILATNSYRGVVPKEAVITIGQRLKFTITAVSPALAAQRPFVGCAVGIEG